MMELSYGLIGEKLGHSYSPRIHYEILKHINIRASYELYEIEKSSLKSKIYEFGKHGIKGLNVTVPYKEELMKYMDYISDEAKRIGAINTIAIKDKKLLGYNTDYLGFALSMERFQIEIKNKSLIILGTGGVSKAVYTCLSDSGAASIIFVSRNPSKTIIGNDIRIISYEELENVKGDTIINCTPLGMYPNLDVSPIKQEIFQNYGVAIDLIYNPYETVFLKNAKGMGLKIVNGLYMLVAQAIASQEIWNDTSIDKETRENIYRVIQKEI